LAWCLDIESIPTYQYLEDLGVNYTSSYNLQTFRSDIAVRMGCMEDDIKKVFDVTSKDSTNLTYLDLKTKIDSFRRTDPTKMPSKLQNAMAAVLIEKFQSRVTTDVDGDHELSEDEDFGLSDEKRDEAEII